MTSFKCTDSWVLLWHFCVCILSAYICSFRIMTGKLFWVSCRMCLVSFCLWWHSNENICRVCGWVGRNKMSPFPASVVFPFLPPPISLLFSPSLAPCLLSFGFFVYFPVLLFVFLDPDLISYLPPLLSLPPSFPTPFFPPTLSYLSSFPPASSPFSGHTPLLPLYSSSLRLFPETHFQGVYSIFFVCVSVLLMYVLVGEHAHVRTWS